MFEQLWVAWLLPLPFLLYYYRFATNHSRFQNNHAAPIPMVVSPFIIFQITTKGNSPIVARVIERVRKVCDTIGYRNYRVDVSTDDPRDFYDANMIRTPRGFQTAHGGRFKSRALHYAVLWRREHGDNTRDKWIFHLDEESFVTEQTILSLLNHITGPNVSLISEGPIVYPNGIFDGNYLTRFSEAIRPFVCYDCIHQMSGKNVPLFMHGSNLLVRSDIEDRIGWDFGASSSEDQRFGQEAYLALHSASDIEGPRLDGTSGSSVFGWHGGILHEQPPLTVGSWIRQRQRWFIGNIDNLRHSRIPLRTKLNLIGRSVIWMAGFPAGLISIAALFIPQSIPFAIRLALVIVAALWLLSFQIGMRLNLMPSGLTVRSKAWLHLQLLALTFFVGLIETYAAISAPFRIRNWNWVPTEKQVNTPLLEEFVEA